MKIWNLIFILIPLVSSQNEELCPDGNRAHRRCGACSEPMGCYNPPGTAVRLCCRLLYSYLTFANYEISVISKDLPSGQVLGGEWSQTKICGTGKFTCDRDEYCGPARDEAGDPTAIHFCYPKPQILQQLELLKDNDGTVMGCTKHRDCPHRDVFCFTPPDKNRRFRSRIYENKGICARARVCPTLGSAQNTTGTLYQDSDFCKDDDQCSEDKINKRCVDANVEARDRSVKVCCSDNTFVKGTLGTPIEDQGQTGNTPKCDYGTSLMPKKECKSDEECSTDGTSWCDSKGICCSAVGNGSYLLCPDQLTAVFAEPACIDSTPQNDTSGTCPHNPGALCIHGRCCPTLTYDSGKPKLGGATYMTNKACNESALTVNLPPFTFCFMDRIVVVGSDAIQIPFTEQDYKPCGSNWECSSDGSLMCVRDDIMQLCIPNRYHVRSSFNILWVTIPCSFAILVVSFVIFKPTWLIRTPGRNSKKTPKYLSPPLSVVK